MKSVILLTLGICVSSGQSTLTTHPAKVPARAATSVGMEISEAQVDKWMKTWRKRLALEDWDISTEIVRSWDLRPDTLGNLRWTASTKTATIRVLDPVDYDIPRQEIPIDIEYTIVHELVHLQLAALPRDPSTRNVEERVVNGIAEALLALEKGPSYRPRKVVAGLSSKDHTPAEASRAARP